MTIYEFGDDSHNDEAINVEDSDNDLAARLRAAAAMPTPTGLTARVQTRLRLRRRHIALRNGTLALCGVGVAASLMVALWPTVPSTIRTTDISTQQPTTPQSLPVVEDNVHSELPHAQQHLAAMAHEPDQIKNFQNRLTIYSREMSAFRHGADGVEALLISILPQPKGLEKNFRTGD